MMNSQDIRKLEAEKSLSSLYEWLQPVAKNLDATRKGIFESFFKFANIAIISPVISEDMLKIIESLKSIAHKYNENITIRQIVILMSNIASNRSRNQAFSTDVSDEMLMDEDKSNKPLTAKDILDLLQDNNQVTINFTNNYDEKSESRRNLARLINFTADQFKFNPHITHLKLIIPKCVEKDSFVVLNLRLTLEQQFFNNIVIKFMDNGTNEIRCNR